MENPKAIVFASSHYESRLKVGSHHYADALANLGYDVLYISFPINIIHYVAAIFNDKHRARIFKRIGKTKTVQHVIPFSLIPVNILYPFNTEFVCTNWIWLSGVLRVVDKFLNGQKCDVVWSESAFFVKIIKRIKSNNGFQKSFYRLSDNVVQFKNFPKVYGKMLNCSFDISDIIVVSASSLANIIDNKYLSKVRHIPNGIDLDKMSKYSRELPFEYLGKSSRKIIYIGALEYWFDWDIIKKIVFEIDSVDIFIVGPYEPRRIPTWAKKHYNVHLLGSRPHNHIGRYISNAAVGIIPFKRDKMIDHVDPIKYYEYSYFGIPTVCSYWLEVSEFKSIINLAKSPDEFVVQIKSVLDNRKVEKKIDFGIDFSKRNWLANLEEVL
jgi:hypothetical protein